jgi:uncharacterized damage-inducible protein DinB
MDAPPEPTFMEFILYNNWANQRVLEACQSLSEDQLGTKIPGGYGPIRETLGHLIRAVGYCLELLSGIFPQPAFNWEAGPSVAEMAAYAAQLGEALVEMARRSRPTDEVVEEDEGKVFHYQARAVFLQIIDHGIEHRTNITTILNQGMQKPPEVDGWAYLAAHPERFDIK